MENKLIQIKEPENMEELQQYIVAPFVFRVLRLFSENHKCDDLSWRMDGEYAPIRFYINCGDLFYWATADAEDLTPDNITIMEQAIEDCKKLVLWGTIYADSLFAARVRKMRPQKPAYPKNHPELWPLYDACGPERTKQDEG